MSALLAAAICFSAAGSGPTLGIDGASFTLDGAPTFLLGASYFGALGVNDPKAIEADLNDLHGYGFNWLRVWATWQYGDDNMSAVAPDGAVREPYMKRLKWLCDTAGKKGFVVDVTVSRGKSPPFPATQAEHRAVVTTLARELKAFRNVYFDVANERNIGDARHVPMAEVGELIEAVKRVDPQRLCTASHGGDISGDDVTKYLKVGKVDFLCPHRPRGPRSPAETESQTRVYLQIMKTARHVVPILYQEPFRRGYNDWNPVARDFMTDLRGARAGGAAGWCFHNGASRKSKDGRPRRSFDMCAKEGRLFQQLDSEERGFLDNLSQTSH